MFRSVPNPQETCSGNIPIPRSLAQLQIAAENGENQFREPRQIWGFLKIIEKSVKQISHHKNIENKNIENHWKSLTHIEKALNIIEHCENH